MSYQVLSPQTRTNKYSLSQSQQVKSIEPQSRQGSNQSGKKILFIKRKVSNPSIHQQPSNQQSRSQVVNRRNDNHKQEYLQSSQHQYKRSDEAQKLQPKDKQSTITLNPQSKYKQPNPQTHNKNLQVHQQSSSSESSMKQSRGQQYEEQLQNIHQDLWFFTRRLEQAENNNTQLKNLLLSKERQIESLVKNVYSFIHRLFSSQKQTVYEQMNTFLNSEDKISFYNMVQKSSGTHLATIQIKQFEKDLLSIINILNLTLQNRNHLDSLVKSTQISLQQNMKQISQLQHQNHSLNHQYRLLQREFNEKSKLGQVARQIQTITLKSPERQKPSNEPKKTVDPSRQQVNKIIIKKQLKHAQTQTEQKRIGSAASIHKYQPIRYEVIPNRSSPYKNYVRQRSISNDSKTGTSFQSTVRYELNNESTAKKSPNQRYVVKENPKKTAEKKKLPATSSYLNHLIQSEHYIIGQQPQSNQRNNRFQQQLDSSKSQLSLRKPPLRSRSQSQQQVPSSKQRTSSKHSIKYTCSRVITTYSLNPVNQYGQKRLCNEANSKRIRKITQLSEESDSLSEKLRDLMEQQEMLKQKFKELQQLNISRKSKKSNQSSRISRMNHLREKKNS